MTESSQVSLKRNVPLTPFKPPFGMRNPHVQTVFSSQWPRKANRERRFQPYLGSQRAMLLNGGGDVRLEGHYNTADITASTKAKHMVILIHGWEGSHESTYIKSMAATLLSHGYDTFRLNLRDHGGTHHLNREVFNSTMIEEVVNAIEDLQGRLGYEHHTLIGFSLGGNFSLRVAASAQDKAIQLEQVIAFCPVVHAGRSNSALHEKRNALYGKYFIKKWRSSLRKKLEYWPEYQFGEQLEQLTTLDEMNQAFIPQYTRFNKIDDYFEAYAINGDKLDNTICPCYLNFAKDDMIIPVQDVDLLVGKPNLDIVVTEHGGHCGFLMNWRGDSWQDVRALEIMQARAA